jgi:membrane protein implicated in regulation of membrane protease activity
VNRTRPVSLVLFAAAGGALVWLLEIALIASGRPAAVPPVTLALALGVIGVLDLLLAVPIRRAVRDGQRGKIDPFYATRVAVLSKASSLAGSLLTGVGLGIVIFLSTRSVLAVGSILMAVATVVGAVVLLVAGLIAEHLCSIPPDDDDKVEDGPATVRTH